MSYEALIECSKCGSDCCFVKEVTSKVTIEWCFGCGFVSNNLLKKGEQFMNEQVEIMPELNKALMVEEADTGKIWMPSFVHIVEKGMVFANGASIESWKWGAVKSIPIDKDEQKKLNTKEKYKADYSTLKEFDEREYIEALDYIGILGDELL